MKGWINKWIFWLVDSWMNDKIEKITNWFISMKLVPTPKFKLLEGARGLYHLKHR